MRIALDDTPYEGRTSAPPWGGPRPSLDCTRCASSLVGRRVAVRRRTTRGVQSITEVFKCRCGRRRNVSREAAM